MLEGTEDVLGQVFARLLPELNERQRRLVLGAAARVLGRGGIRRVARASGAAESTVALGMRDLAASAGTPGRVRSVGGGRKSLRSRDAGLVPALLALVEPEQRGDPESPLRWTVKSTRNLAAELTRQGHQVGSDTVAALLKAEGFSLQAVSRTTEGARHPDRDAQFRYINDQVSAFLADGQPVVSVDAKKKETLGQYWVPGREWQREGQPVAVRAHDFPEKGAAKAVPYGVYDLGADAGWVTVGCDGDTAAFAVSTLRRWWEGEGRQRYPAATRLLITADAGGSNGYRVRAWKKHLADFAHATGLEVTVCHFPPGTSKWNKIEHRLFSQISTNWRGRPLTSHEVVVNLIGATTTRTGLTVRAEFDPGAYPTGITVPDEVMAALPLTPHEWHGSWNYTMRPAEPVPVPEPRFLDRSQPPDRAPAWLRDEALTGFSPQDYAVLLGRVEQHLLDHPPISIHHKRARHRILRRGPLSLSDRLLIAVIRIRWKAQAQAIKKIMDIKDSIVADAMHEMTPILDALGHPVSVAGSPARTADDLTAVYHKTRTEPRSY